MSIKKITEIILAETGIDARSIGDTPFIIASEKCMKRLNITSLDEYLQVLEADNEEMTRLIEEIVIPETWFFRGYPAFQAMIKYLKDRRLKNLYERLNILSLPSSSGEEAYSIAINLLENGYSQSMFRIDAVDISQTNINSARAGIYRKNSFRKEMPDEIIEKYFTQNGREFHINDYVRNNINFSRGNLFDFDTLATAEQYDVIFCRNLFIYFNTSRKSIAFSKISNALKKDGLLIIGHAEASIIPLEKYMPDETSGAFAYTKNKRVIKKKTRPVPVTSATKKVAATLARKIIPQFNKSPGTQAAPKQKTNTPEVSLAENNVSIEQATDHANKGDFANALKICNQLLSISEDAHCLSLMATIYSSMGDSDKSEQYYRKALFINPKHHESLIQLALLLDKKGDSKNSELLMKRAQKCTA